VLAGVAAVKVDHRGPLAVVAHAVHQLPDGRARASSEGVPGMSQVVKVNVNVGEPGRRERGQPYAAPEVAVMERLTFRAGEDEFFIASYLQAKLFFHWAAGNRSAIFWLTASYSEDSGQHDVGSHRC
jgi:hypothetical protein